LGTSFASCYKTTPLSHFIDATQGLRAEIVISAHVKVSTGTSEILDRVLLPTRFAFPTGMVVVEVEQAEQGRDVAEEHV
jgi:hypothetical protein